jgi:hypothetical protein
MISIILSFYIPIVSLILLLIAFLIAYLEFFRYKKFVDPLFKTKTGTNLTAIKKNPNAKQRIFFTGHMDAAWEFTYNYHFGIKGIYATMGGPFLGIAYFLIAYILVIINPDLTILLHIGLIFIPFYIAVLFFWNPFRIVPGANDNLTGCLISVSILKALKEHNIDLENTEVGIILTGSEEAGTRGAKAWSEKHKNDYKDIPTYILAIDTINDPDKLSVTIRDLNGSVQNDKELATMVTTAAKELNIKCEEKVLGLPAGSTDAAAFTQGGFKSICLVGMDYQIKRFYHTRIDNYDNLNDEAIDKSYQICIKVIENLENKNS